MIENENNQENGKIFNAQIILPHSFTHLKLKSKHGPFQPK